MNKAGDVRRGKCYNKQIWVVCPRCGNERWVYLGNTRSPCYTGLCRTCNASNTLRKYLQGHKGIQHPHWRGGRARDCAGYILVWLNPRDKFYPMADYRGYVLEHRLVVAKYLGRCLNPQEVAHHINEDKADNRIDNLLLFASGSLHTILHRYLDIDKYRVID